MLTRGLPLEVAGFRSHSGREISPIVGMPKAASTSRESHTNPRMLPAIQWQTFQ
jgi:hypothetical protein